MAGSPLARISAFTASAKLEPGALSKARSLREPQLAMASQALVVVVFVALVVPRAGAVALVSREAGDRPTSDSMTGAWSISLEQPSARIAGKTQNDDDRTSDTLCHTAESSPTKIRNSEHLMPIQGALRVRCGRRIAHNKLRCPLRGVRTFRRALRCVCCCSAQGTRSTRRRVGRRLLPPPRSRSRDPKK